MSDTPQTCLFTEGCVTLPDHYLDRTVNVLTPSEAGTPAFNISRDTLNDGETLSGYIDRQLAMMQQHLKGWKQTVREPAALGDDLLAGECLHASYLRDGKRIHQQQAVFNTAENQILVFTMTATAALTDTDNATFRALLASFRTNA